MLFIDYSHQVKSAWLIRLEFILASVAWSNKEYFYFPLDGMLVHHRVIPSIKFAGTHLYTWVKRGTVKVKCLAQEHSAMSMARARTRTAPSRHKHTNHEATFKSGACQICKLVPCIQCTCTMHSGDAKRLVNWLGTKWYMGLMTGNYIWFFKAITPVPKVSTKRYGLHITWNFVEKDLE